MTGIEITDESCPACRRAAVVTWTRQESFGASEPTILVAKRFRCAVPGCAGLDGRPLREAFPKRQA